MKVKTVSEDTKTKSNPLEDFNSDENQNEVISFEAKNSTNEFDPKLNCFECMSCGYVYDPDEGIKKLNIKPGTAFIDIDKEKGIADWGAGVKVPIKPFFGNFGVAPPKSYGKVPSTPPAAWGGNTDNKEFITGTKIFFPIFNDGALFSVGDGHGCQGDGEANINGIEMGLIGTFEFKVRKDFSVNLPVAESETHHIFMGFDPILDNAAKIALRETIDFLKNSKGLHPDDAYTLCSLAVDLRVTQIVNGYKGVHAMLPKSIF